jgi:hypothetical protein
VGYNRHYIQLAKLQQYARIYNETLDEQFKIAMPRLEAIAVDDWPGVDASEPALAETWTVGPAQRFNVANMAQLKVSPRSHSSMMGYVFRVANQASIGCSTYSGVPVGGRRS